MKFNRLESVQNTPWLHRNSFICWSLHGPIRGCFEQPLITDPCMSRPVGSLLLPTFLWIWDLSDRCEMVQNGSNTILQKSTGQTRTRQGKKRYQYWFCMCTVSSTSARVVWEISELVRFHVPTPYQCCTNATWLRDVTDVELLCRLCKWCSNEPLHLSVPNKIELSNSAMFIHMQDYPAFEYHLWYALSF